MMGILLNPIYQQKHHIEWYQIIVLIKLHMKVRIMTLPMYIVAHSGLFKDVNQRNFGWLFDMVQEIQTVGI